MLRSIGQFRLSYPDLLIGMWFIMVKIPLIQIYTINYTCSYVLFGPKNFLSFITYFFLEIKNQKSTAPLSNNLQFIKLARNGLSSDHLQFWHNFFIRLWWSFFDSVKGPVISFKSFFLHNSMVQEHANSIINYNIGKLRFFASAA